eukprot:TRINITY_DN6084_c0_g1_i1.p1 TRINITY_DN6084_c0_g1~~TRINITY_DN6084_c0_g1_i1.p1  ORF type:complete len:159 (+),score=7.77 TRINITY_DN6084_c0_g1_i1:3-479(+)
MKYLSSSQILTEDIDKIPLNINLYNSWSQYNIEKITEMWYSICIMERQRIISTIEYSILKLICAIQTPPKNVACSYFLFISHFDQCHYNFSFPRTPPALGFKNKKDGEKKKRGLGGGKEKSKIRRGEGEESWNSNLPSLLLLHFIFEQSLLHLLLRKT